jgi:biotin transport system substrate-specific component
MAEVASSVAVRDHRAEWLKEGAIIVSASLFVALCAHLSVPLPFTPVPLTLQNFAVLLVGMALGSRRGFAALALYLVEGSSGLPVFSPAGPGGVLQLFGPTGGFLMAYPLVAGLAGWITEHGKMSFAQAALAGLLSEVLLFAAGIGWLVVLTHSFSQALRFGLYAFIFAEIIKILAAAAMARCWQRVSSPQELP